MAHFHTVNAHTEELILKNDRMRGWKHATKARFVWIFGQQPSQTLYKDQRKPYKLTNIPQKNLVFKTVFVDTKALSNSN